MFTDKQLNMLEEVLEFYGPRTRSKHGYDDWGNLLQKVRKSKGVKVVTLGQAAKMTGVSKPTISKAVMDRRVFGKKVDGVFQIEVPALLSVYPAKPATETKGKAKVIHQDDSILVTIRIEK